jgi:hypothetical protein
MFDIVVVNGISHGFRRFGIDFACGLDDIVVMGSLVLKVEKVL